MCGIVAYKGPREAYPILIKGLKRLEYRGYDSSGVALINDGNINLYKKKGKVSELEEVVKNHDVSGHVGIGHTRWATHGEPNDLNAHPHLSQLGELAIIHNGIIENYHSLKQELIKRGHEFKSDTDTEVLVHLIEDIMDKHENISYEEAVRVALSEVIGAFAIVILNRSKPETLVGARKGSPMVLGIGDGEFFIASDAAPLIEYTKNVVYLDDNEIVFINGNDFKIKTIDNIEKTPYIHQLEMNLEQIEKGGFDHFMIKEIYEQPKAVLDSIRGRISVSRNEVIMSGVDQFENKLRNIERIIIVACGTSYYAGLVGEYLLEELARIPVEVEYASEFRYRNPIISEKDFVIAISQSGETADTLAAIELAKSKGATIFGICNVVGSSIPRATHAGAYTHAGPEIGVASTKAFSAQITALSLIALSLAQKKGTVGTADLKALLSELESMPAKIEKTLKCEPEVKRIAEIYKDAKNALYLGRGFGYPVALEGALKLKEISYIHAEGYPAAEMKHGPIALIDENMPVVVIATDHSNYEKVVSNIQEVKARKGKIIAIVTEGDTHVTSLADHVIAIPACSECFLPLLSVVPLQLLSYHIAVMLGRNVDQPRNLAKSVTVE